MVTNASELLQLRRETCEAIGWQIHTRWSKWIDGKNVPAGWPPGDMSRLGEMVLLPALESDNGFALDALDKRCVVNDWSFEVFGPVRHPQKPHLSGKYGVRIAKWDGTFYLPFIEEYGDKISEACCRALVASAKKEGGEK